MLAPAMMIDTTVATRPMVATKSLGDPSSCRARSDQRSGMKIDFSRCHLCCRRQQPSSRPV